jgi:hypothetical protein
MSALGMHVGVFVLADWLVNRNLFFLCVRGERKKNTRATPATCTPVAFRARHQGILLHHHSTVIFVLFLDSCLC